MNELVTLTATEMRRGLLRGDFSATELTKAHLDRIEATNPIFNSFITVTPEIALTQAKEAEQTLEEKKESSPALTGIPIAIKDMLCTQGIETTCGSNILKGFVPPYDCTAVAKLRRQGAVVLGKTNLDEFAMGSSNENSAFGPVRNPYDLERVPGGSSGGSAVAVAIGQAPLSLGTDTGGSIRQPASLSGIVGLKPTYGRVSRYGAVAFASSLDQIGPFARNVPDLALALGAIAGHDANDSTSMKVEVPDYSAELDRAPQDGLRGVRIGVPRQYFIDGMQPDVQQSIRDSLKQLENLGAELVDISLPHTEYAIAAYYILAPAEASSNLARYDGVRYGYRSKDGKELAEMYENTRAQGFGAEVKRRIIIGNYVLSAGYYDAYYRKAQEVRTLIINDFKAAFTNRCHIIAAPASPTTAFKLGEKVDSPLQMYLADVFTIPASLAGLAGLSVPAGFDGQGLPIGLQMLGAPFTEPALMKAAHVFMNATTNDTQRMTAATWK